MLPEQRMYGEWIARFSAEGRFVHQCFSIPEWSYYIPAALLKAERGIADLPFRGNKRLF